MFRRPCLLGRRSWGGRGTGRVGSVVVLWGFGSGAYVGHEVLEPGIFFDELFEPVTNSGVGIFGPAVDVSVWMSGQTLTVRGFRDEVCSNLGSECHTRARLWLTLPVHAMCSVRTSLPECQPLLLYKVGQKDVVNSIMLKVDFVL